MAFQYTGNLRVFDVDLLKNIYSVFPSTYISSNFHMTNDFSHQAQWFSTLFMFLGGLPFLLFVAAYRKQSLSALTKDAQVIGFF